MTTLIIDSALKQMYIALVKDNKVLFEKYELGKNDHAKNIVALVDLALSRNKMTVDNLDEIVCGVGPGSYTGVRMAVTIAKMIGSFKKVSVYPISSLFLMASGTDGVVLSTVDARRGNSFGAIIDTVNGKFIVNEGLYETAKLKEANYEIEVNEENFVVNPLRVIKYKGDKVENIELLVPNYLRDTEAERNLHDKETN